VIEFVSPIVDMSKPETITTGIFNSFERYGVTRGEAEAAVRSGLAAQNDFRRDIRRKGEETLERVRSGERGIVLSGMPYHIDPEINHGIAGIICEEGFHVLTEDSIAHLGDIDGLRVNTIWAFASRRYAAAKAAAAIPLLDMIHLNSFGCGVDSVSVEQVEEILTAGGKIPTILKIDDVANLGAARIRVRSLKAALAARDGDKRAAARQNPPQRPMFTRQDACTHTIIIPAMTPIREQGLLDVALNAMGYRTVYLTFTLGKADIGLQYVNNDFCHMMFDYVGQLVDALRSGDYDLDHVGVMMMESCSFNCRGCNYIPIVRKALDNAGFSRVPVVSYQLYFKDIASSYGDDIAYDTGLALTMPLLKRIQMSNSYGELFERVVCGTRPYETHNGQIDQLHSQWISRVKHSIVEGDLAEYRENALEIIHEFDNIPLINKPRKKIGLVGDSEIPFDYSLPGTNNICRLLEAEGAEVVIGNTSFMGTNNYLSLGETSLADEYYELVDNATDMALRASRRFLPLCSVIEMKRDALEIAPFAYYNNNFLFFMGGRIQSLLKLGVKDIVNFTAFNCSLNYVVGTGYRRVFADMYPGANIVDIEFLQGIPAVNQINRIRLMMRSQQLAEGSFQKSH